ncbi:MAG: hypothetical protein WDW38_010024 [Sanguina aurantia]
MSKQALPDDGLDKVIKYLAKRDGIDKTLKIIRYTSRIIAAVTPATSDLHKRCTSLDSSVGVSRKAFRLGKFLQDINNIRKCPATDPNMFFLELVANGGEGIYYFLEQFAWLMKAGAMSKVNEKKMAYFSAWAELLGYIASVSLSIMKLDQIVRDQVVLHVQQEKFIKDEGQEDLRLALQIVALRYTKGLRMALIVQDMADAMIAINDIRGGRDVALNHPITLALAGLTSAAVSTYKLWNA